MNVRRGIISLAVLMMLLAVLLTPVSVTASSSAPILPTAFYGTVTINGSSAPIGTVVTATIVPTSGTRGNPGQASITVSGGSGQYGTDPATGTGEMLTVETDATTDIGQPFVFSIQALGYTITSVTTSIDATYDCKVHELNIAAFGTTTTTSSGSSGGGGSATYTLTVTVDPADSGSVTLSPSGGSYASGTSVTLTATANTGFTFSSWSGDASGTSSSTSVTMSANKSVTANFTAKTTTTTTTTTSTVSVNIFGGQTSITVDANGATTEDVTLTSPDGTVSVFIPKGTKITDANGNPITSFSVEIVVTPILSGLGADQKVIIALKCSPTGAQFSPAITLTFNYTDEQLAALGVSESSMVVGYFDDNGALQEYLDPTIDAADNIVTQAISHFSNYALIGSLTSVTTTTALPTSSTTTQTTLTTTATSTTTSTTEPVTTGTNWGLILGIIGGVVVIAIIITVVVKRKRD